MTHVKSDKQATPWPDGRGVVSLTFDDGCQTQLQHAVPLLDEHGFRATFYLIPCGAHWEKRLSPWHAVAEAGHEIGNHSLSHICSDQFDGRLGGLEEATLDSIESDILAAQDRLNRIAPHQRSWTFCYPCYCTFVGRGLTRKSYVPVVAKHFLAGRAGEDYGFGNAPAVVDLSCVWSKPADRLSSAEMIGLVEKLTASGRWVVFAFHEINGDRLSVEKADFVSLLTYLSANRDRIRVEPFGEAAGAVARFQQTLGTSPEKHSTSDSTG